MPTHNGRTLTYASANIKIRKRDADGVVREYDQAGLEAATNAQELLMLAIMNPAATTTEARKTDYVKDGSQNVLDTAAGIYVNTWESGTEIDYTTELKNSAIFVDAT